MSTQKPNEDVKNNNARIAIGDLNAKGDVRGGGKKSAYIAPPTEDPTISDGKDVSTTTGTTSTP